MPMMMTTTNCTRKSTALQESTEGRRKQIYQRKKRNSGKQSESTDKLRHTHTCTNTCAHKYTYTCTHTYTHTCTHTYTQTNQERTNARDDTDVTLPNEIPALRLCRIKSPVIITGTNTKKGGKFDQTIGVDRRRKYGRRERMQTDGRTNRGKDERAQD